MLGKCKMTGNEKMFPCSAAGCPLFGDCLVEYEKEHKKNTAKPQTNADRIRAMSDEELAKFIVGNAVGEEYQTYEYEFSIENVRYFKVDYEHQGETAEDSVLYWLKQPADMRGEEDG